MVKLILGNSHRSDSDGGRGPHEEIQADNEFLPGTLVLAGLLHSAVSWLFLQKRMPNAISYETIGFCFVGGG